MDKQIRHYLIKYIAMKPSNNEIKEFDAEKLKCEQTHIQDIFTATPAESFIVRGVLYVLNVLTYFFLYTVVISSFLVALYPGTILNFNGPETYYTWHIFLCVTGYVIILSQAILSFNPHAGWAYGFRYDTKRKLYATMQVVGSLLALAGCILKISDWIPVTNPEHAVNGWIAMILTFISLIAGILNMKYEAKISDTRFKNAHIFPFLLSLFIAFICLCYAFSYRSLFHDDLTPNASIACAVIALVGIIVGAYAVKIN